MPCRTAKNKGKPENLNRVGAILKITIMPISKLDHSEAAEKYYSAKISKNTDTGAEKYVLTDGNRSVFVSINETPAEGESIWKCRKYHGEVLMQQHK